MLFFGLSTLTSLFVSVSDVGLFCLDWRDRRRSVMIVSVSDEDDDAESSLSLDGS